jgi:hypothetical protein
LSTRFKGHRYDGACRASVPERGVTAGLISYLCGSGEEVNAYLAWLNVRAKVYLTGWRWRAVQRFAKALLIEKPMTGRRARESYFKTFEREG